MTQTPPFFSTSTPRAMAGATSDALVTGPIPTAPCASASLAMSGIGSSSRRPIQRFFTPDRGCAHAEIAVAEHRDRVAPLLLQGECRADRQAERMYAP